jgi:acetylornithine deacetylase/succinyl-diaminopimelate desuccinylase-like protein
VEIEDVGSYPPGRSDPDDPFIRLVVEAARGVYDHEMLVAPMTGGSGPNAAFIEYLGVPIATSGMGYPGARIHDCRVWGSGLKPLRHKEHQVCPFRALGVLCA